MIKIKLIDPQKPDQPQFAHLEPETALNQKCLIGRSPNCDLVLDSIEVSRMHGKISAQNGNYYFTDLGSSCGSRLNGENAQINLDYLLHNSDIIQIGKFSLIILQIGSHQDITVIESHKNTQTEPLPKCVSLEEYTPVAMVEPDQLQRWVKGELTVRCLGVIDETHNVKTFRFVADPPVLFTYKPGQRVTLELEINGELLSHSYSISSTPSRPHCLEITIKHVSAFDNSGTEISPGLVSNWLYENLRVGSKIRLNEPEGNFTSFANLSRKLLLLSAGSGIAPMMSISRWLFDTIADCDLIFFHSARTPRDIIFRQELELMSARHPNFHLVVTTTQKEPLQSWLSLTGRLNPAMLQLIAPDLGDRTVYVCGPDTFMASVNQMLASLDFPMKNYYEESFQPPQKKSKLPSQNLDANSTANNLISPGQSLQQIFMLPTETHLESNVGTHPDANMTYIQTCTLPKTETSAVVFSKSGKEVVSDGFQPILNLAEQAGVKISSSCRTGVCGSCKKRKLQGEVRLSGSQGWEDRIPEGYILTCISYPIGSVVIDA